MECFGELCRSSVKFSAGKNNVIMLMGEERLYGRGVCEVLVMDREWIKCQSLNTR